MQQYTVRVRAAVEIVVGPFDSLEEAIEYASPTNSTIVPLFKKSVSSREYIQAPDIYALHELIDRSHEQTVPEKL
jgi:hypothetical protein